VPDMPLTTEQLRERVREDKARLREMHTANEGRYIDPETPEGVEWAEREARIADDERAIAQNEQREAALLRMESDPGRRDEERGAHFQTARPGSSRNEDIYDLTTVRASVSDPSQAGRELRDRALRHVERTRFPHPDIDQEAAKSRVEALLRYTDSDEGRFARYCLAVGDPAYRSAFWKWAARGDTAGMNREDHAAWERGQMAERALSLTGSAGGFAVPFELDPTIINTSNGVANPIRQLADVQSITTDEWRGISSAGITASYAAEATEATDNAPTLGQPTISTEKAQAFVPFSIEVGQDWRGLEDQMSELLADARDTLEAGKFVSGTGTSEPFGVLTGATTTVAAATGLTITLANLYSLKNALPPRHRNSGSAAFIANVAILDRFRQMDTVGSQTAVWADSLRDDMPDRLLGKPVYEASEITGTITNATKIALFGNFRRFKIVDRVGLTVDVIPHLFGANRRPTGERGLYAYWRNGSKVTDANAFRALVGTT
jgi:HK97 family phage major capsid protein